MSRVGCPAGDKIRCGRARLGHAGHVFASTNRAATVTASTLNAQWTAVKPNLKWFGCGPALSAVVQYRQQDGIEVHPDRCGVV